METIIAIIMAIVFGISNAPAAPAPTVAPTPAATQTPTATPTPDCDTDDWYMDPACMALYEENN